MTWPTRQRCNALASRLTKYELNNITTRTYVVFKLVYTVHYLASVQQTHHAIPGCTSKCTLFGWQGWTSGKEWFWRILAHPMKHGSNFESLNITGFSCMHTSCKVKLWVYMSYLWFNTCSCGIADDRWPYWGRSWDGLTGSTIPSSRSCLFASSCPSSSRERCGLTGLRPRAMWGIGQSFVAIWQRDHIPTSSKFPCCFFFDLAEWVEHNGWRS